MKKRPALLVVMMPRVERSILRILIVLLFLCITVPQFFAADLSDYAMQDYAQKSEDMQKRFAFVTLLPDLPWGFPNIIDPAGDAQNASADITAVYVDEDETNIYFRINFSETGDSAEAFTRYIYLLIDGKVGGKKRVAKNVHADIPWDILIKLKNPDDLAMYDIHELVTTEIRNFSSNPDARVIGFYVKKQIIESVIPWHDVRFQVFTQDKATNLLGDGTAVFYRHNETRSVPDLTRMLESVGTIATAPESDEDVRAQNQTDDVFPEQEKQNGTLQYSTATIWLVPPWLLILAGSMIIAFICILISLSHVKKSRRKEAAVRQSVRQFSISARKRRKKQKKRAALSHRSRVILPSAQPVRRKKITHKRKVFKKHKEKD